MIKTESNVSTTLDGVGEPNPRAKAKRLTNAEKQEQERSEYLSSLGKSFAFATKAMRNGFASSEEIREVWNGRNAFETSEAPWGFASAPFRWVMARERAQHDVMEVVDRLVKAGIDLAESYTYRIGGHGEREVTSSFLVDVVRTGGAPLMERLLSLGVSPNAQLDVRDVVDGEVKAPGRSQTVAQILEDRDSNVPDRFAKQMVLRCWHAHKEIESLKAQVGGAPRAS